MPWQEQAAARRLPLAGSRNKGSDAAASVFSGARGVTSHTSLYPHQTDTQAATQKTSEEGEEWVGGRENEGGGRRKGLHVPPIDL